jgi:hypothetical protein
LIEKKTKGKKSGRKREVFLPPSFFFYIFFPLSRIDRVPKKEKGGRTLPLSFPDTYPT